MKKRYCQPHTIYAVKDVNTNVLTRIMLKQDC